MLVLQVFLFKDGSFLGNEMATGERIEVGRDPACDVLLDDEGVSRKHCFLFEHEGRLAVQDAGSHLGTRVNGESCATPRYVGPRDDVAIGRFTLKFKQIAQSSPSIPAPSFGEVPATAHIGAGQGLPPAALPPSAPEPTAISSPGQPTPALATPAPQPAGAGVANVDVGSGLDIQFPTGLHPSAGGDDDDDATMVDPSPLGDLDAALDNAFPEAGLPTVRLKGPDLGDLGPTLEQPAGMGGANTPAPVTAASQPSGEAIEAPFDDPIATALPPPTPGAAPGSVPPSDAMPATQMRDALAKAETAVRLSAGAMDGLDSISPNQLPRPPGLPDLGSPTAAPHAAAPHAPAPHAPAPHAPAPPGTLPPQPGSSAEGEELAALVDGADDAPIPSIEWSPGAGLIDDDDEDEDEDPLPGWSIVEALVSAQESAGQNDDGSLVEVIHYRNDRILDHAELLEGERFDFGRVWNKEGLQDVGVGKSRALVRHKKGGVAELIVSPDVSGMLLREGQQVDLKSLPEAQGKKGKVPLTLGDFASLELFGDRVFVRIGKAPAVKPTAEMIASDKRQRKLTATAFGIAIGIWLLIFALAWIAQYRALAETVIQLEDEGFAEIIEPELELEEPEPEPEEPKIEEEAPKPEEKEAPKPDPKPQAKPDAPKKPGVLDALKNVPKARAGNQSLSKAMSNIKGVRVPGASGFKVSSVVGKGPKGVSIGGASGGVDSKSLNSILRKGGGAGNLATKKGRRVKGRVKTLKRQSKVKGQGILTKDEIMKVINKHIGKIQYCYEKQLRIQPGLSGKVQLEWVIGKDGRVKSVKSSGSSLRSPAAINCMSRQVKAWKFPKPRGSGTVIVKFPFVFNTL